MMTDTTEAITQGGDVANKDKGSKSTKKEPKKNLKEKRAAKKAKGQKGGSSL